MFEKKKKANLELHKSEGSAKGLFDDCENICCHPDSNLSVGKIIHYKLIVRNINYQGKTRDPRNPRIIVSAI